MPDRRKLLFRAEFASAGAALALAGTEVPAVTRNLLAEPGILVVAARRSRLTATRIHRRVVERAGHLSYAGVDVWLCRWPSSPK